MDLLARRSAADADSFIRNHQASYNPFTALVADRRRAYVFYNAGRKFVAQELTAGLHVFSSAAEFDLHRTKPIAHYALLERLARIAARRWHHRATDNRVLAFGAWRSFATGGFRRPGDSICVHRDSSARCRRVSCFSSLSSARFEMFSLRGRAVSNASPSDRARVPVTIKRNRGKPPLSYCCCGRAERLRSIPDAPSRWQCPF